MPSGAIIGTKHADASSKFYGVSLLTKITGSASNIRNRVAKPWMAYIRLRNGNIWKDIFATEREAAIAYDRYVLEHKLDRPLNILKPKVAS